MPFLPPFFSYSGVRLFSGKPEDDFANLIALGFSALITPDDYVQSKI
jgi:hypothetical protein